MTHGMMTGHQASTGIMMMTSTAAGPPWAGWPSSSGMWGQVRGKMPGRGGEDPQMDDLTAEGADTRH